MATRRIRTDDFVQPCIPAHTRPGWVYEVKHDGYRLIVTPTAPGAKLAAGRGAGQHEPLAQPADDLIPRHYHQSCHVKTWHYSFAKIKPPLLKYQWLTAHTHATTVKHRLGIAMADERQVADAGARRGQGRCRA
jgi:hypothetical protein